MYNEYKYILIEEYNYLVGYLVTREEWESYTATATTEDLNTVVAIYDLKAHGKTYPEKKAHIEGIAIDYSNADNGNLGLDDLNIMYNFFEDYGRRYGLLTDFRENAII